MISAAPTIISADGDHVVAEWQGHTLAMFGRNVTVEGAQSLRRTVVRLARANPGRSAYLSMLHASLEIPSEAVRSVYVQLGREIDGQLNCIAVVVGGAGFTAAALRAVVTGIGIAARVSFPLRTFSTLDVAAAWVRSRVASAGAELGTDVEIKRAFAMMAERQASRARGP